MRQFLYLFYLLPISFFWQQEPRNFHAFDENKQLVFIDEFDKGNVNKWHEGEKGKLIKEDAYANFDSGRFFFRGYKNGFNAYPCVVQFDYKKNYEIEIKAKITTRKPEKHGGIIFWGREDYNLLTGNYLYFYANTKVSVSSVKENVKNGALTIRESYQSSKDSVAIDYNVYTIRRFSDSFYVFVNGVFMTSINHFDLEGGKIGLGGNTGARVSYDYIKMSYLP